jgi:hypothetical protein
MKKNMGNIDRIARVVLGVIFAFLYATGAVSGVLGIILMLLAVVFVVTSVLGFCPLYLPFKFNTLKYNKL